MQSLGIKRWVEAANQIVLVMEAFPERRGVIVIGADGNEFKTPGLITRRSLVQIQPPRPSIFAGQRLIPLACFCFSMLI